MDNSHLVYAVWKLNCFNTGDAQDIYGWTSRGARVQLETEFPTVPKTIHIDSQELPPIGGIPLPLEEKKSEWKTNEDAEHHTYYYNSLTKVSSWTNPDEYTNRRRLACYLCVIERPLLATMGDWRFQKIQYPFMLIVCSNQFENE